LCGGNLIDELLRIDAGRIGNAIKRGDSDTQIFVELYWASISRSPTIEELSTAAKFVASKQDRRQALEDVCWALLNSNEFLLRY
jgi:hypothetical protein